ncbi:MAG TPA: hypothetical protein VMZ69_06950, partial [Saprospiraceae bacterium]|nr:hypothetical protein [Saprospiraceae bacterium]
MDSPAGSGTAIGPDGTLYYLGGGTISQVDLLAGTITPLFTAPPSTPIMLGIVCTSAGIFYTMPAHEINPSDILYKWDLNLGIVTPIGPVGFNPVGVISGEMTMQGGKVYYIVNGLISSMNSIFQIDINNPPNSQLVVSFPINYLVGSSITASPICHTLLAIDLYNENLVLISLIDGSITTICETSLCCYMTSIREHLPEPDCVVQLDLDCNDSSGATDADFNSPEFNCLSDGVPIADDDIKMLYDAIISTMTINVTGFTPDAPNEVVDINGTPTNISVTGAGTDMITLTNIGGAKSTDFKDALHMIVYKNTSIYPTAGLRTVEVQFTTESGMSSNIATAFIEVTELPLVTVDIGPDQQICDGETATFDAGNPGATYQWSNGPTSQINTVSNSGEYIVTVSDGENCPNQDTALLEVLPIIHVSLTGDTEICDNEQATLIISTDSPFPLIVDISAEPGSPFQLTGVIGNYSFTDLPTDNTEYLITNVQPSQPGCIELVDPYQAIEVFPTYMQSAEVSICDGDSVWLGFYWETEAGIYENTLSTIEGCDSLVITTLQVLPAITISAQGTTCDSAQVGVFTTFIDNPTGCDTIVRTTVSLLPSDTTLINLSDCNAADTGSFQQVLTNVDGCDSLVITHVSSTPGLVTNVATSTCDSSQLGVFQNTFLSQIGCDSVVITTVSMMLPDTTYQNSTSCDPASIGTFEYLFNNQQGCDSLVISTVSAGIPDTT